MCGLPAHTLSPSVQLTRTATDNRGNTESKQAEKGSWLKQVGKVTRVEKVKSDRQGVGGEGEKNKKVKNEKRLVGG